MGCSAMVKQRRILERKEKEEDTAEVYGKSAAPSGNAVHSSGEARTDSHLR